MTNPLLHQGIPLFDQIEVQHIEPAMRLVLDSAEERFAALEKENTPTWEGLIEALVEIEELVQFAWSPVSHLRSVRDEDDLRQVHEKLQPELVKFFLRVQQSEPIFKSLCQLRDSTSWQSLDQGKQRAVSQRILSAELAGVGLSGERRSEFNQLASDTQSLQTKFANHVLDATKKYSLVVTDPADMEGLPASVRALTAEAYAKKEQESSTSELGPWLITLDAAVLVPFLESCPNSKLRREVYLAYISRASQGELDNQPLILQILRNRKRKAELLGLASYAELSLKQKMVDSVEQVFDFQETLRLKSYDKAQDEHKELTHFAQENGHEGELCHWDVGFWAKRLREAEFGFSDEDLRPYFELDRSLDGLFALAKRLFGVQVKRVQDKLATWHPDVRYFEVFDASDRQIAAFFLDPFSRPENKRGGAWMDTCISRRVQGGLLRIPVAYLVCNSTPPSANQPSLMTFREVETLFHEFGHGLQHMLTKVDEVDVSGINGVEWDAVELPSQFMENWCYDRQTLMSFARHWESDEELPEELYQKLVSARTFRAASAMLRQLQFGLVDWHLHTHFDPLGPRSVREVYAEVLRQTSILPILDEDQFLCSFSHIFAGGYAAGYYSYKWAEVLSADAFEAFVERGIEDDEVVVALGRKFRDTVLALGGSRSPIEVFKEFRGRQPSPEPLLRQSGLL